MGIFLGQLPPAELARLKAELAETLIANFCYPRFFDYRTESLRMRPVDRAKRQEVWLYLSSVDFTTWNRVDVLSPDFQRQLERLFIQFVQRNRSFFGEQGRKRMSDVRMLISSSATTVTQNLRTHIAGQRPTGTAPFGSPRPVISWSTKSAQGKQEATWEKIAAATMLLQQQLLEVRASNGSANGEIKTAPPSDGRAAMSSIDIPASNGTPRRIVRPHSATKQEPAAAPTAPASPITSQPTPMSRPPVPGVGAARPAAPQSEPKPQAIPAQSAPAASAPTAQPTSAPTAPASKPTEVASPAGGSRPVNAPPPSTSAPTAPSAPQAMPASYQMATNRSAQQATPIEHANTAVSPVARATSAREVRPQTQSQSPMAKVAPPAAAPATMAPTPPPTPPVTPLAPMTASRSMMAPSAASTTNVAPTQRENPLMRVGDDDIAIFEQMRHQMLVWLRIEVIRAGLELTNQTPSQLLELLRRQDHMDETRLQVVSTLLNLANQVITNGQVSVLDYKQALMFHLMHTRR